MDINKIKNLPHTLPYRFDENKNAFILSLFNGSDNDVFKAMIHISSYLEEEKISYTIRDQNIYIIDLEDTHQQENMILKLNRDGEIVYINEYACNVTGYKQNEVLGKNWFNYFIPHEDKKNINELFNKILKKELALTQNTNAIVCKDQTRKMVAWNNCLLTSDDDIEALHCTGIVS